MFVPADKRFPNMLVKGAEDQHKDDLEHEVKFQHLSGPRGISARSFLVHPHDFGRPEVEKPKH